MIIGALIGIAIALLLTFINIWILSRRIENHNNNRLAVVIQGQAKMNIFYGPIIMKAVFFSVIGAIIGHYL